MLRGKTIMLRPVRESDIEPLYQFHLDIANRGAYFPVGVMSESVFRKQFTETGLWEKEEGMLVIVDLKDDIVGHIEFFRTVNYLDELELSYHVYSPEYTGKGIATEAVKLLTRYLFNGKKFNRIRLIIHPDNLASQRVALKCGYQHEGTARGAWFHQGRNHDVEVFALVRDDYEVLAESQ